MTQPGKRNGPAQSFRRQLEAARSLSWKPRNIDLADVAFKSAHCVVDVIKRRQTNISVDRAFTGNLIDASFRDAPLRWLQRRADCEEVTLLVGMRREVLIEPPLDQTNGLHCELERVDGLICHARVEQLALNFQAPSDPAACADRRLNVRAIEPINRPPFQMLQFATPDELIDSDTGNFRILFVRDQDCTDRWPEPRLFLGELDEIIREQCQVSQALLHPPTIEPVSFDCQFERVPLPAGGISVNDVKMGSHETDGALCTAGIFDDHIATAWNIGKVLDSKRASVVTRIRTQSFKHDLHGAFLFRHVFRRIILKPRRLVDECREDRLEAIMVEHDVHDLCSLLIVKNRAVIPKVNRWPSRQLTGSQKNRFVHCTAYYRSLQRFAIAVRTS